MSFPPPPVGVRDTLVSYFWSHEAIRSRSVSAVVPHAVVSVPPPPTALVVDWEAEISLRLQLEPGDVEPLPLARARRRWPDYRRCVAAASAWTGTFGMRDLLASCDVALMACRGANYHHDGGQYGGFAFCNLFLSEDKGLDLHFPGSGQRIPLVRGTVVVFDTGQPHAVIRRNSNRFDVTDFPPGEDCSQMFLTWELPIENSNVAQALHVAFDVDTVGAQQLEEEQIWRLGARSRVCADTGQWCSCPTEATNGQTAREGCGAA